MATITANITSSEGVIPTSAEMESGHYTIDSENIYVYGTSRGQEGRSFDRLFASVERGVGGSTAASHTSGATLTRYYPDAATSGPAGSGGNDVYVDLSDPSVYRFASDESGEIMAIGGPGTVAVTAEPAGYFAVFGDDGSSQVYVMANDGADLIYIQDSNSDEAFYVKGNGLTELRPVIIGTSAPADGLLSSGQVALWFDATNGAAKLKIKGKSANGTVVVGEVALT